MTKKLRLYHIPQLPMKPFHVEVDSVDEAAKIANVLSDYDAFQYKNKIKPDYCNATGLESFENGEWSDWYDEESGTDFDEFLEQMKMVKDLKARA